MKKNGFTLIELMVVVVIIGILAAIVVPVIQRRMDKGKPIKSKVVTEHALRPFGRDSTYFRQDGDRIYFQYEKEPGVFVLDYVRADRFVWVRDDYREHPVVKFDGFLGDITNATAYSKDRDGRIGVSENSSH